MLSCTGYCYCYNGGGYIDALENTCLITKYNVTVTCDVTSYGSCMTRRRKDVLAAVPVRCSCIGLIQS